MNPFNFSAFPANYGRQLYTLFLFPFLFLASSVRYGYLSIIPIHSDMHSQRGRWERGVFSSRNLRKRTLILLLFSAFFSTSLLAASYSCDGENVANIHDATSNGYQSYSTGEDINQNSRYFKFRTQIDGDITITQDNNKPVNGYWSHRLKIGTSCEGTDIHDGSSSSHDSKTFSVTANTWYYVRVREGNSQNVLNFDITFDFIASAYTTCETAENLGTDPANRVGLSGTVEEDASVYQTERWYRFQATAEDEANGISFTAKNIQEDYNLKFVLKEWDASGCPSTRLMQSTDFVTSYNQTYTALTAGQEYAVMMTATSGETASIDYTLNFSSEAIPAPVSRYTFDDCNISETLTDDVGTNNGIASGVEGTLGILCNAGEFQGVEGDQVTLGNAFDPAGGAFSFSAWIKWDGVTGENTIVDKQGLYNLRIDSSGNIVFKTLYTGTPAAFQGGTSFPVPVRQWTHVALTFNGYDIYKLYRDGGLVYTYTDPDPGSHLPLAGGGIVTLGAASGSDRYSGDMDEASFYNVELSEFSITKLVNVERLCPCCPSPIEIVGGFVTISDTYDASAPPWDKVTYTGGFKFRQTPLVFILASPDGGHSADMRVRNITREGFEVANIEPQGEDGPHIAMNLSYFAISRGIHELGNDQVVEACSYMTQTVQYNNTKTGDLQDINPANLGWDHIPLTQTYTNPEGPAVVAQIMTANNEQRLNPREISRPWVNVAIENNATGVFMALERGETTWMPLTYPEEIAYMVAEGNIQSTFVDDTGTTIAWETIVLGPTLKGTNHRNDTDQRFTFVNSALYESSYGCDNSAAPDAPNANPPTVNTTLPLVAANINSRNAPDGGWIRRNALTCQYLGASIWEDRIGAWSNSSNYSSDGQDVLYSDIQDSERVHDEAEKGSAFVYANAFYFAAPFEPEPGAFNAVEVGNLDMTDINTKVVNKNFSLDILSVNANTRANEAYYGPVRVRVANSSTCESETPTIIDELGTVTFDNVGVDGTVRRTLADVNSSKITRNGAIRMEYLDDGAGNKVDFETCYTLGNFASYCDGIASSALCNAQCTTIDDMKGIGTQGQTCLSCLFNNYAVVGKVCATDDFAVRPDHYTILIDNDDGEATNLIYKAQENFSINVIAVNNENNASYAGTADYNQTLNQIYAPTPPPAADSFEIYPIDNTPCPAGEIRKDYGGGSVTVINSIPGLGFSDGNLSDTNIEYSEVGDIQIVAREIEANAFAYVDQDDTNPPYSASVSLIEQDDINVSFTPDVFDVNWTLGNFNGGAFTYFSNDPRAMRAELDVNITALGLDGETTVNYTGNCHAKNTNLGLLFNITNESAAITPPLQLGWSEESTDLANEANASIPRHVNPNAYTFPSATTATGASFLYDINMTKYLDGSYVDQINLNISRDSNRSTNPIVLELTDLNATDVNSVYGTFNNDTNVTYFYGRLHAPRYRISGNDGNVTLYYEVYCDSGCTPTNVNYQPVLYGTNANPTLSVDDINWYRNEAHRINDGNTTWMDQRNLADNQITLNTSVFAAPLQTWHVTYDESEGYPFKTTMQLSTQDWLLYNKYVTAATVNNFELEFNNAGNIVGKHINVKSADSNASRNTNRRIQW